MAPWGADAEELRPEGCAGGEDGVVVKAGLTAKYQGISIREVVWG